MNIDDVARPDGARVVEISRFEEERIERTEVVSGCIATCHIKLNANARPRRRIFKSISYGRRKGPGKDAFIREASELNDGFDVVVESRRGSKYACPKRVALFLADAGGKTRLVILKAQIVEIRLQPERGHEHRSCAIYAPEELVGKLVVE